MRRSVLVCAVLPLLLVGVSAAGNIVINPDTTLKAQTANNSSAADSFSTQSNGNLGANNVSKLNIHSLLYPGATTKVYAHLMLWFGQSNHMDVGYSSKDAAQVKRQINDMVSRGIDGVIIDWYGPNTWVDSATKLVMAEAEKHSGFKFAIMVDQGAIKNNSCSGCSPQEALIDQLQYVERTYFTSPAYMTVNGVPAVTNFDIDLAYSIDWNAVDAALGTHPLFLFQNNSGFTHTQSNGSYSWVMPSTTDYGMSYLASFYNTGKSFGSEYTVGATYKGFNDTLAGWGSGRIMKQQCGQTWLQTFSKINSMYNSGKQLPFLQLVTWNDYEEGSEIESGIDSCFSVSASVSANTLKWSTSGSESTVDHYRVYISTDGQNLMTLADLQPGNRSLNMCSYSLAAGTYKLFVQAAGRPSLANHMTGAVTYQPSCGTTSGQGTEITMSASPHAIELVSSEPGEVVVSAKPRSGSFDQPVALSCDYLPVNLRCSFSPARITPGAGTATSTLTVSSIEVVGEDLPRQNGRFLYASSLFGFGIVGLVFAKPLRRLRSPKKWLGVIALLTASLMIASCGGASSAIHSPAGKSYTIAVRGDGGTSQASTDLIVTVQ